MGKKKEKKVNAKALRYAKFQKDKPGTLDLSMPDLSDEQSKQKQADQDRIDSFLRHNRAPLTKERKTRQFKSKR